MLRQNQAILLQFQKLITSTRLFCSRYFQGYSMEISPHQLIFNWTEDRKFLKLTNTSSTVSWIFKIKTTDIKLLTATPCKGFLQPNQTKVIEVKSNQIKNKFQAKLQIMSAPIDQKLQSFDSTWNKIDKTSFSTNLLLLSRSQVLESIKQETLSTSKFEEEIFSNKSFFSNSSLSSYQLSGIEASQRSNQMETSLKDFKKVPTNLVHSVTSPLKPSQLVLGGDQPTAKLLQNHIPGRQIVPSKAASLVSSQGRLSGSSPLPNLPPTHPLAQNFLNNQNPFTQFTTSQLAQICHLQGQLLSQKEQNQRLRIHISKNKQYQKTHSQSERQIRINQSMSSVYEKQEKINWAAITLVALVFFSIGVLLSDL